MKNFKYLISGTSDKELHVWELRFDDQLEEDKSLKPLTVDDVSFPTDTEDDKTFPLKVVSAGSILRKEHGRVVSLMTDQSTHILACLGTTKSVELFQFCDDETSTAKFRKRKAKQNKKDITELEKNQDITFAGILAPGLVDEVKRLSVITSSAQIKSLDIVLGKSNELRACVSLSNNTIELCNLVLDDKQSDKPNLLRSISTYGHHNEVKAVCFTSDNLAIATGSAESVKLWNRPSLAALRTIQTEYVLSMAFAPGDRFLLVGLKSGRLSIIDIAAGEVIEDIAAHNEELWSICPRPDMTGCATGGGDNTVKFWEYALIQDQETKATNSVLSLTHTRTLKLDDKVLCVKISANLKFVAAALLDSTVKIFFLDTFKFYLSLYGHKLPVLCMDISMDSHIMATGSADRNIKIWGMDFGDCHRSLFAHDDSVTGLQFVGKSHHFFSCGKDGKIKQWDGDTFDKIITLQGHVGAAYGLSVSPNGKYVVSCGADRVVRLYERTDEPLVLSDVAEEEREEVENNTLATGEDTIAPSGSNLKLPSRKTVGSEKSAEAILECLEISALYQKELDEHANINQNNANSSQLPQPPPLMQAYKVDTPDDFFIHIIRRIRLSDLNEALVLLPFSCVTSILQLLPRLLKRGDNTELLCNLTLFLLKVHHEVIISNKVLLSLMQQLESDVTEHLSELRDFVGLNLHIMKFMQREIEESNEIILFKEAIRDNKTKKVLKRQREKAKRSILALAS